MSSQASWKRCDFQLHTCRDPNWNGARPPGLGDEHDGVEVTEDILTAIRSDWAGKFVAACKKKQLEAIAVTEYDGPLVGVGLDPFSVSTVSSDPGQILLDSPARIGASLSVFEAGPIGRWYRASSLEIYLPDVALSSVSEDELLGGANRFAIETALGWEVFQAAQAELTAPGTYQLRTFLRGLAGSDADMMAQVPSGARVIWLGAGWSDIAVSEDLLGAEVSLNVEAAGREGDPLSHLYKAVHLRPLSPVHVKAQPREGGLEVSWIRRTRIGGDSWQGLDVPLGEEREFYQVQLWAEQAVQASFETTTPEIFLETSTLAGIDKLTIAQGSRLYGWGALATLAL